MAFGRWVWTLTVKNLRIIVWRNPGPTSFTALMIPIALAIFLSLTRRLAAPPSVFGIGTPSSVLSLADALDTARGASGSSGTVVFVNSGHSGGLIDRVIDIVAIQIADASNSVKKLPDADGLHDVCRTSHRGVTDCFGAVVFNASPDEGAGGIWNYTLRADSSLGLKINTNNHDNSAQVYTLPLQRAIDSAIAGLQRPDGQSALPNETDEYPFTSLTADELSDKTNRSFQSSIVNYLAVSFLTIFIGACYHVTAFITLERETGMTDLLEAMLPTTHHWEAQAARFLSYHLAFTLVYFPGWLIGSIILGRGIFPSSNIGAILIYFLLCGMSLVSLSILAATFFTKSQLSNFSLIVYAILGIIAQTIQSPSTATAGALSALFAPCNFVFFITWVARWEQQSQRLNLAASGPGSSWTLAGILLWVFLIFQTLVYPLIAVYIERIFHGVSAKGRTNVHRHNGDSGGDPLPAIMIDNLTKIYKPRLLGRLLGCILHSREPVIAVDKLTLSAEKGQILALLGANGSGKSTTLDCITGINTPTRGNITIDVTGGIGITPQKNVLWDDLSVFEHVEIFNQLKTSGDAPSQAQTEALVSSVDLGPKMKALSKTLSGGQKRKLQLGMMLAGGSAVCCVDEVSSSLDPLSRRKVWDILLAERGKRTVIMTTHFLDEAEVLADRIVVLSNGTLRAQGTAPELKNRFGAGHKIHVTRAGTHNDPPKVPAVTLETSADGFSYIARTSADAAKVIITLERSGFSDYTYSDPTLESVFLQLAEEIKEEARPGPKLTASPSTAASDEEERARPDSENLGFLSGRRVGYGKQIWILFLKRCTILKTDWAPYLAAFAIPIVTAGLTALLIKGQNPASCVPVAAGVSQDTSSLFAQLSQNASLAAGPPSNFTSSELSPLFSPLTGQQSITDGSGVIATGLLAQKIRLLNSIGHFNSFVELNRKNVTPAGLWLGDASSSPTIAYMADQGDVYTSVMAQNALDVILSNTSIATAYTPFDSAQFPNPGQSLQLVLYLSLALSIAMPFFGLYPNLERRHKIRALQYSNGVLPLALWTAHIALDFTISIASFAVVTIIFVTLSSIWYHVAYLFLILILYSLASVLLTYVVSLLSDSQSSTYAAASGVQGFGTLIYFLVYSLVMNFVPVAKIDTIVLICHFVISIFAPIGSVMRALFVALNLNSTACSGDQIAANPAAMTLYGGPILYLIVQSFVFFGILLWNDSGASAQFVQKLTQKTIDSLTVNDNAILDKEVADEVEKVMSSPENEADGLRVVHLSKAFSKNKTVVDNVTFRVRHNEMFALLGPNGAGKSVTISMVRGDTLPSRNGGDVFVEGASVTQQLAAARAHLGVCPQDDAIDSMSVEEHLRFYARIRGVADVQRSIRAVLRAVGLEAVSSRIAHALSGGNKRKLSLAIALMGNPSVVLLDEPSCGLDAAAKRDMWRTLKSVAPDRAILITTHSMEEADALASRVGIMAKRMLAVGSPQSLRQRFDKLQVHLVSRTAPHTTDDEVQFLHQWILARYAGAEVEEKTYHGQTRFSVPAAAVLTTDGTKLEGGSAAAGQLVVDFERHKEMLDIEYFSVSRTTLDQVFLNIVGQHQVQEENYETSKKSRKKQKNARWKFSR